MNKIDFYLYWHTSLINVRSCVCIDRLVFDLIDKINIIYEVWLCVGINHLWLAPLFVAILQAGLDIKKHETQYTINYVTCLNLNLQVDGYALLLLKTIATHW